VQALRLAVRGGTAEDGTPVEGLPLNYGRVAEYYSTYGLALARTGNCREAVEISQALARGVPNDEISLFNAQEITAICKQMIENPPTPPPEATQIP